MLIYEKGDLLKSNCRVIVHGVNCQGRFGKGFAQQVKDKYPFVEDRYKQWVKVCVI